MTRDGPTTPQWDLIRAFLALERHGSYEVAAEMEGIDDSTLRRRIRLLEQHFGRALFVRAEGGWRASADLNALISAAQRMEEAARSFCQDHHAGAGVIRISVMDVFAQRFAPVFAALSEKYPKLVVDRLEWSNEAQVLFGPQVGAGPTVLVQSHGECVTTLPPGGVQLASSQTIPHEVFLVNGQFLGIQGHPEVDRQFLQQKFMAYHRALFDDDEWVGVQQESQQDLDPERVIALGRRLLDAGRLPATPQDISALPA